MIRFAATALALFAIPTLALAESAGPQPLLDQIDAQGFRSVAQAMPDVVLLHSVGDGCSQRASASFQHSRDTSLPRLLSSAGCSVSEWMTEARVSVDEIVDARIRYLHTEDEAAIRAYFASLPSTPGVTWRFERVAALPITSPYARFGVEVAARSSDSDLALTQ